MATPTRLPGDYSDFEGPMAGGVLTARNRLGLSRKVVADLTGLSEARLRQIEDEHQEMTSGELVSLSYTLCSPPSELLGPMKTNGTTFLRPSKNTSPSSPAKDG